MPIMPTATVKPGYKPQAEDTSIDADVLMFQLLRQRSSSDRLSMASSMVQNGRRFSLANLNRQFADRLAPTKFALKVAQAWLQEDWPSNCIPQGSEMTWIQDSSGLAAQLHGILTALAIPYYVTGGLAAIAYGEPRTTRDVDIVIAIDAAGIDALVNALEAQGFYVPGVEDFKSGRMMTLSVTDMISISRADLVMSGNGEFDHIKLTRRSQLDWPGVGQLYFASPEDVILNKLQWRQRNRSDKQWRDVLGILKVQGESLDFYYLQDWAKQLELVDDLAQAMLEAGL
jgi:hypothetical protein